MLPVRRIFNGDGSAPDVAKGIGLKGFDQWNLFDSLLMSFRFNSLNSLRLHATVLEQNLPLGTQNLYS